MCQRIDVAYNAGDSGGRLVLVLFFSRFFAIGIASKWDFVEGSAGSWCWYLFGTLGGATVVILSRRISSKGIRGTFLLGLWVTRGFGETLGGVSVIAGAPSEVAGGRRVLSVSALEFWVDGATLANILASCLSSAIFSTLGGTNGAVGTGFVRV